MGWGEVSNIDLQERKDTQSIHTAENELLITGINSKNVWIETQFVVSELCLFLSK